MSEIKPGQAVVITFKRVMRYGAIAELDEYPGVEAFLHITEVSSKWIKNINDYVKVGQRTVAKVLEYDPRKKVATVSLRRLSEDERKKKLEEFNNINKARKVLQAALKQSKSRMKLSSAEEKILKDYENLYDFMLDVLEEGEVVAEEQGFSKTIAKTLASLVQKSFKSPEAVVRKMVDVVVVAPDGIDAIKKAFKKASTYAEVKYLGAPHYLLITRGEDYKEANKKMAKATQEIEKIKNSRVEIRDYEN